MPITGTTRVFYVLGDPVAQVRAPEVYNHLFQRHGVDAVMVPLKLPAAALAGWLEHGMKVDNVGGFLATIPHKGELATRLAPTDAVARIAHAVNAVKRHADGRLEGALFDGIGFVNGLDHFGIAVEGARVLVVGAGGGGHAVAAALAQRKPAVLAIANRTRERAAALVERLVPLAGGAARVVDVPPHSLRSLPPEGAVSGFGRPGATDGPDPKGFDLVVNCTSQGLKAGDAMPFDPARLDVGAAVVDIIMSREPTPLLRACRERGLHAEPGFEMLVQQIPEVVRFFGFDAMAGTLAADMSEVRALLAPR